jgi:putative spermidine/putrescine transport system substrate-binding protein
VTLNVIDVAGNLQLTQVAIERFARENPKLVSRLTFSRALSPELPASSRHSSRSAKSISTWC